MNTYVDYEGDNVDLPEDDDLDEYEDDSDDWRAGECDHCFGETVDGPLGPIHCACAVGLGADEDDCVCGPPTAAA